LNPSDIKAYKDFYDAVQPLRVGQDEQWRKLAYLALCSMKLQHSPEAVFRLIKEAQLEVMCPLPHLPLVQSLLIISYTTGTFDICRV